MTFPRRRRPRSPAPRARADSLEPRRLLATGTITGVVFHDHDGNGFADADDRGIPGTVVYADLDHDGAPGPGEPTAAPDPDGRYSLEVEYGTRDVRVVLPPGYSFTYPAGGYQVADVPVAGTAERIDFGANTPGSVEITVFNDLDGDDWRDPDEPPVAGQTVYLEINGNDRPDPAEPSRVTGPDGVARFDGVAPGPRLFLAVLAPGWSGGGSSGTGYVVQHTVQSGQQASRNLSVRQPTATALIDGTLFDDADSDRVRDPLEPGLAGRTVFLDADHDTVLDDGEQSALTDAAGRYRILAPAPGWYYVRQVVPGGWSQTTPRTWGWEPQYDGNPHIGSYLVQVMPFTSGGIGYDFGSVRGAPGSISGAAYDDRDADGARDGGEPPLAGGRVYVDFNDDGRGDIGEPFVDLDDTGAYAFDGVPPGTYALIYRPPADYTQTEPGYDDFGRALGRSVTVQPGADVTGADFGAAGPLAVGAVGATVFIDSNGNGVRDAGDGVPPTRLIYYLDLNDNRALDADEPRRNSPIALRPVRPGSYTVRAVPPAPGYRQTVPLSADGGYAVTVRGGESVGGLVFGFAPPGVGSAINGTAYDDRNGDGVRAAQGEGPRAGVTVWLDLNNDRLRQPVEPTARTDTLGFYSFTNLAPGTYTVRAEAPAATTATAPPGGAYTVTLGAESIAAGNDFGWVNNSTLGRIIGVVFDDADGDGVRDTTDPVVPGRTVWIDADADGVIDANERTATQTATGYTFDGVAPNTYTVRVFVPTGMRQTQPVAGAARRVTVNPGGVGGGNFGLARGADTTPPAVTAVMLRGSAWSDNFLSTLNRGLGDILPAPPPPRPLPWTGADTLLVRFSEDVRVQRDDLTVRGADGKAYEFRSFAYDPVALVATWVLAKPFAADRVRLELDGYAPGGAADAAGNYLADGDVVRTFDILPGDANGDGVVNAIDLAYVKRHLGTSTFDFENYSVLADLNGDGRTNALDVAAIKQRLGRRLPAAPTTDLLRAN